MFTLEDLYDKTFMGLANNKNLFPIVSQSLEMLFLSHNPRIVGYGAGNDSRNTADIVYHIGRGYYC
mgnify:CR=1 FL=1